MAGRKLVIVIGGGFAGLKAVQGLRRAPVDVLLLDRRNFHLFQPLLYQVATGALSPGDVASPLRAVLRRQKNATVLLGSVSGIDLTSKTVEFEGRRFPFDVLILASGVRHSYFGHDEWEPHAPGLKSLEDALEIRRSIYLAFERAEVETDPVARRRLLTFVIVGAGPTGVEMAGAMGELAQRTLKGNFRNIDPSTARIVLMDASDRVLGSFPPKLSGVAARTLQHLGVETVTGAKVTHIENESVTFETAEGTKTLEASTVVWAAGVRAPVPAGLDGETRDRAGRLQVTPGLTLTGHPEIYVVGDLAGRTDGAQWPGVAQNAMQQGRYAARSVAMALRGQSVPPYRYKDKGDIAVIGRNAAVFRSGKLLMWGFPAWAVWAVIHLGSLIGFDNKVVVMVQWLWDYLTFNRTARLIGGARGHTDG